MGNKGAFIRLEGKAMKPDYITYEAVVSKLLKSCFFFIIFENFI
jgi:hypothetical protein